MLEPRPVALEHLHPRVQVMAERHGLRALHVRVAGQRRLRLALGDVEDRLRQARDGGRRLGARVPDVEARRSGDLVVARAAGVDLPADRAEQPLDGGVHVLVLAEVGGALLGDRREPRLDVGQLAVVEDADRVQPLRMHGGRCAVVRQQLVVLGAEERVHVGIERDAGAGGPERHAGTSSSGWPYASRNRRVSAMSFDCSASWPMRSAAVNAVALRSMLSRSGSYVSDSPRVSRIV